MSADLSALREEYTSTGLNREDLEPEPITMFDRWFAQACKAGLPEPNAMSLATADRHGHPTIRTVLLKAYDDRGFVFYTNYESVKARQIADNPHVALCFPWIGLQRQVCITGQAERVSHTESLRYFLSRPVGSQIGAWVSLQSSVISSRQILESKFAEMKRKFREGKIPLPDNWGGFRVRPASIEFWQGRTNRLHDRFLYTLAQDADKVAWEIQRLSP